MGKQTVSPIVCFGEVLWDCLPRGIFLGGAPLNVAYHLSRQGACAIPVSAVGRDFLGAEARGRIAGWGIESRFVPARPRVPTGTVRAVLDRAGVPTYRIARSVAWDRIAAPPALGRRAPVPVAVVFGTLALREPSNRGTLARLLARWPQALRVVDINLRAPFDRRAAIAFALGHAQLLKLNDHELATLAGGPVGTPATIERAARDFGRRHNLTRICVTSGARGAGLLWQGEWFWESARPVKIRDTIGAGDAFLSGLLAALLVRRATPPAALAAACRMGEFVAGRDGATPPYRCGKDGRPADVVG